jgi:Ca2+-binding EF-hand superfamily protein
MTNFTLHYQFEEFQEAVMPFLMDKMTSTRLTEVEIRSTFDTIDRDRSGTISREEFRYAFVEKLQVLELAKLVLTQSRL